MQGDGTKMVDSSIVCNGTILCSIKLECYYIGQDKYIISMKEKKRDEIWVFFQNIKDLQKGRKNLFYMSYYF